MEDSFWLLSRFCRNRVADDAHAGGLENDAGATFATGAQHGGEIIVETNLRTELNAFQFRAFGNLDGEALSAHAAETLVIGQDFDGVENLAVLGALLRRQLASSVRYWRTMSVWPVRICGFVDMSWKLNMPFTMAFPFCMLLSQQECGIPEW